MEALIGRGKEVKELISSMKKGRSTLLVGPIGVGKTHILKMAFKYFVENIKGIKIIFVAESVPLKTMLFNVIHKMHEVYHDLHHIEGLEIEVDQDWKKMRKPIKRMPLDDMATLVSEVLKRSPYIIILDHLEKCSPSAQAVIDMMMDRACVIGACTMMKPGLRKLYWKFYKMEIENLDQTAAKELINYWVDEMNIRSTDMEMLKTRLLRVTRGNPSMIKDILEQGALDQFIDYKFIREIDEVQHAGTKYIDLTPGLLIVGALVMTTRFVALGIGDKDLYVLAGAGTAIFMVIRFFVARSMRKE